MVLISFFALSILSPSACLPFRASLNSLPLSACTEGDYLSSVSSFQLTWRDLDLPKLLVLPINETEHFPMLLKNTSDKKKINVWRNAVNCSVFSVTRLGRVVGLGFFILFFKQNKPTLFHLDSTAFSFVRLTWKILNCSSSTELSLNCSTPSFH